MTKKTSPAYRASKEETIPINKLHPFSNHPFHIRHDLEFSELVDSMLRQTKDIDSVVELYGLSDPQKNYLKLAKPGQGILKMGNNLIPFVNDHPTNTKIYRLLTTKPGEMEN